MNTVPTRGIRLRKSSSTGPCCASSVSAPEFCRVLFVGDVISSCRSPYLTEQDAKDRDASGYHRDTGFCDVPYEEVSRIVWFKVSNLDRVAWDNARYLHKSGLARLGRLTVLTIATPAALRKNSQRLYKMQFQYGKRSRPTIHPCSWLRQRQPFRLFSFEVSISLSTVTWQVLNP